MWNSIEQTLRNYFKFGGRSGRREFWIWTIMVLTVSAVAIFILAMFAFMLDNAYNQLLSSLYKCILLSLGLFWIAMSFPSLTVSVRRLRDTGISPWIFLITTILCIFTFLALADIGLSNMDGTPSCFPDAFAFILSVVTATTCFVFLILFCLPSKK